MDGTGISGWCGHLGNPRLCPGCARREEFGSAQTSRGGCCLMKSPCLPEQIRSHSRFPPCLPGATWRPCSDMQDKLIVVRLRADGTRIHHHLPDLRSDEAGDHAGGRLPILLRVCGLRFASPPTGGRMLCVLLLREHSVPTEAAGTQRSPAPGGIAWPAHNLPRPAPSAIWWPLDRAAGSGACPPFSCSSVCSGVVSEPLFGASPSS